MKRICILTVAAVAAFTPSASEAAWYKKFARPFQHPVGFIKHDVAPVVQNAAQETGSAVKDAAVDTGGAVKHAAAATGGAINSGLGTVDKYTLRSVKEATKENIIDPVMDGIKAAGAPVIDTVGDVLGDARAALRMKHSFIPGGDKIGDGVGWVSKQIGLDAEVGRSIMDPTRLADRVIDSAKADLPDYIIGLARSAYDMVSIKPTTVLGGASQTAFSTYHVGSNAAMAPVVPFIRAYGSELMLEAPDITIVGEEYSGTSTILFVNGVANTREDAISSARKLADATSQRVALLYNENNGVLGGGAEGFYDRLSTILQPGPLKALQHNTTTRQLTSYIIEAAKKGEPLKIVTHSQGCLIAKQALESAGCLDPKVREYIQSNITWIACSPPFANAEVNPKPFKVVYLQNPGDSMKLFSLRMDHPEVGGDGHAFAKYLPHIKDSIAP